MSTLPAFTTEVLDRMVLAVELVKQRLLRATRALETAGVPYAVIGGNAIGAWVSKVDVAAVRNTVDVDLLIRRSDYSRAIDAMTNAGFIYRHIAGIDCFLDGPRGKYRDAVHIIPAGEKVRREYLFPAPDVEESQPADEYRILSLEALVRMKLTSFRTKDQTHLIDLISLRMITPEWCDRYPPELAARLRQMLEHPEVDTFDYDAELNPPD
jgi:hypothetical protein